MTTKSPLHLDYSSNCNFSSLITKNFLPLTLTEQDFLQHPDHLPTQISLRPNKAIEDNIIQSFNNNQFCDLYFFFNIIKLKTTNHQKHNIEQI